MKAIFFFIAFTASITNVVAQKYVSEKGAISFFSAASLEDIKAENSKVMSLFNPSSGDIAYSLPVSEFKFEKKLMGEHFNEKYMESDKYPKATFKGKLSGYDLALTSVQNVVAQGKLTVHGVTKDVSIPGTFEIRDGKILVQSKFIIKLVDYEVKIPQLMWQNIAEQVEVTLNLTYKPQ